MKKDGFNQGKYMPVNPSKYMGDITEIVFRSGWELKFMRKCDLNPNVLKWTSEQVVIPYFSHADNKVRRYFVDFAIQLKTSDGEVKNILIEIKPNAQTKPPRKKKDVRRYLAECKTYQVNQDKWKAADEWARRNGFEFQVLTEYELGLKKPPKRAVK